MTKNQILAKVLRLLQLNAELEEHENIHESIKKGIIFRGTNLWILIFAIVVASVGLNMNSTAVIIGAMLISPLMGPINGLGYSVATYDIDLFRKSFKNFGFAVVTSIITSFLYFKLSPVSNAQSEILSRTSPTIFDVLIALFGGFAGIVALCSKNKGNVLPGVAIATALMPPLCTAGYGLAMGKPSIFFGAFYLFTINSVFIALSSMIVSHVLKFPKQQFITARFKKLTKIGMMLIIPITVLPSFYFGYTLVQKEKFDNSVGKYIEDVSNYKNCFLLKNDVDHEAHRITLIYAGNKMSPSIKKEIIQIAKKHGIKNTSIIIKQGIQMNDFRKEFNEVDNLKEEFSKFVALLDAKNNTIDSLKSINDFGAQLLKESQILFPEVQTLSYSQTTQYGDSSSVPVYVVTVSGKKKALTKHQNQISNWLKSRVQGDSIMVTFNMD